MIDTTFSDAHQGMGVIAIGVVERGTVVRHISPRRPTSSVAGTAIDPFNYADKVVPSAAGYLEQTVAPSLDSAEKRFLLGKFVLEDEIGVRQRHQEVGDLKDLGSFIAL